MNRRVASLFLVAVLTVAVGHVAAGDFPFAPKEGPNGLDGKPLDTTKWKQGVQKSEPASGNSYPDSTGMETEYTNTETDETITNQTIVRNSDGAVVHNHAQPGLIE